MALQSLENYGFRVTVMSGAAIFFAFGLIVEKLRRKTPKLYASDSIYARFRGWMDARKMKWGGALLAHPRLAHLFGFAFSLLGILFLVNVAAQIGIFAAFQNDAVVTALIPGQQVMLVLSASIVCGLLTLFAFRALLSAYSFVTNKKIQGE